MKQRSLSHQTPSGPSVSKRTRHPEAEREQANRNSLKESKRHCFKHTASYLQINGCCDVAYLISFFLLSKEWQNYSCSHVSWLLYTPDNTLHCCRSASLKGELWSDAWAGGDEARKGRSRQGAEDLYPFSGAFMYIHIIIIKNFKNLLFILCFF